MMKNIGVVKWFLKQDDRGRKTPTILSWVLVGIVVFAGYAFSQQPQKRVSPKNVDIVKSDDLLETGRNFLQDKGKSFSLDLDGLMNKNKEKLSDHLLNSTEQRAQQLVKQLRRRVDKSQKQGSMIVYDATQNYSSERIVPLGSMVKCLLIHNIVTNDFDAPVIAQVWEDFYFGGDLLLPFGTRIYGRAFSGRKRDRVAVAFHSIVFPDGKTIKINAIGLSQDGSGGLTGKVVNDHNKKAFIEMATNFLSGLALGLQDTATNTVTGLSEVETSSRNALLNGVSTTFNKQAQRIQREINNAKGYAVVLAGSEIIVYFEKEADVQPL